MRAARPLVLAALVVVLVVAGALAALAVRGPLPGGTRTGNTAPIDDNHPADAGPSPTSAVAAVPVAPVAPGPAASAVVPVATPTSDHGGSGRDDRRRGGSGTEDSGTDDSGGSGEDHAAGE